MLFVVLTLLSLVAAACGGDDDGESRSDADQVAENESDAEQTDNEVSDENSSDDVSDVSPVAQALAAEFLDSDEGDLSYSEAEAECMGEYVVDELGEERLGELGVTADDVPDFDDEPFEGERDEAEVFADATDECVGFDELIVRLAESEELDSGCLEEEFGTDNVRAALIESLLESAELEGLLNELVAAVEACGGSLISDADVTGLQENLGSTRDEAECVLQGWVDEVGAGALGMLEDGDATAEQAEALVAVLDDCFGVAEFYAAFLSDGRPAADAICATDEVGDDALRELFIADVTGGATAATETLLAEALDASRVAHPTLRVPLTPARSSRSASPSMMSSPPSPSAVAPERTSRHRVAPTAASPMTASRLRWSWSPWRPMTSPPPART